MAKKTKEPAVEIPKVKKVKTIEDYYSIGKWRGFNQFKCKLCAFDSLDKKVIEDHIREVHLPKPIKVKEPVKLYDRYSNEIIKK